MFMAVLTARTLGLEPEECLSASSEKFIRQFAAAEKIAKEEEKPLSDYGEDGFSELWQKAAEETNQ